MKPLFYRRDGKPYRDCFEGIVFAWEEDFNNPKKRIVKQETLSNGISISTIWLGIDRSFLGKLALIFQTMSFYEKSNMDLDRNLYSTEKQALKGHKAMVKKWSAYKTIEQLLEKKEPQRKIK